MIQESYNEIKIKKRKFGDYKKFEFHLHTPASYDYKLFSDKLYKNLSEKDIEMIALEKLLVQKSEITMLKQRYENPNPDSSDKLFKEFKDLKEVLSYYLIAKRLYEVGVDAVVVSDHNTVEGFYKLEFMSSVCYSQFKDIQKKNVKFVFVLFGVEISCSEENHLICIQNKKYLRDVREYLNQEINSEKAGSYRDSMTLMKNFWDKFNSVCYLAHHNTSNFNGSLAYKEELYTQEKMKLMGISNKEGINVIKNKLSELIPYMDYTYIYEGDAHDLESIGKKNTWIKINNITFNSFVKSIRNRKVAITIEEPKYFSKCIKGMHIKYNEDNFLVGDKEKKKDFIIDFSPELNCIIGGRGTGKSTILNTIDLALSRESSSLDEILFISKNKCIDFLVEYDNREYMLRFLPQVKNANKYYYLNKDDLIEDSIISKNKITLGDSWIEGYEIKNKKAIKMKNNRTNSIINKIFRRGYNINKLVNMVEEDKISIFIDEVISYGMSSDKINEFEEKLLNINSRSHNKFLKDNLLDVIEELENMRKELENHIDKFNKNNINLMRITYINEEENLHYI